MDEIVKAIVDIIQKIGGVGSLVAAVFLLLWYVERRRADRAQTETVELTREAVAAMKDMKAALDKTGEHGAEIRESVRRIAESVTILSARRRG